MHMINPVCNVNIIGSQRKSSSTQSFGSSCFLNGQLTDEFVKTASEKISGEALTQFQKQVEQKMTEIEPSFAYGSLTNKQRLEEVIAHYNRFYQETKGPRFLIEQYKVYFPEHFFEFCDVYSKYDGLDNESQFKIRNLFRSFKNDEQFIEQMTPEFKKIYIETCGSGPRVNELIHDLSNLSIDELRTKYREAYLNNGPRYASLSGTKTEFLRKLNSVDPELYAETLTRRFNEVENLAKKEVLSSFFDFNTGKVIMTETPIGSQLKSLVGTTRNKVIAAVSVGLAALIGLGSYIYSQQSPKPQPNPTLNTRA